MSFQWIDLFGYVGSIICIAAFAGQMIMIYRSKSAKDISYVFIVLQLIVNTLFVIYNIIVGNIPLLLGNGVLIVLVFIMGLQKYYYDNNIVLQYELSQV